jgi:hypothetical protein
MREDNVVTEIMNAFTECTSACATLANRTAEAKRDDILDAVAWFVEAAPLIDGPNLQGPTDLLRAGAAVAERLKPAVIAWDGTTEPPPSLVDLAREFLVAISMPDLGKQGA